MSILVVDVIQVEAQSLSPDVVRFLEQSTFGPTYDLIAHVQAIGFDAFLTEQAAAPTSDYPELSFWPQTRPTTCTNVAPSTCQRDNYSLYLLGVPSVGSRFAFHPSLSGLQQLWHQGNLAAVCNVGPLIEPTSRDSYINGTAHLPLNLFSH